MTIDHVPSAAWVGSHGKSLAGKRVLYAADAEERGGGVVIDALLRAGAAVLAVSRSELFLNQVLLRLGRPLAAQGLTTLKADLGREADTARVIAEATANGQTLDAVVANLGCSHLGLSATCGTRFDGTLHALGRAIRNFGRLRKWHVMRMSG